MAHALTLAKQGWGHTSPNPMVGALIVKENQILGEGYHKKAGTAHAEVNAFQDALNKGHDVTGATLYVTLEPCSHYGKTPPCANLIIEKQIARVVIGCIDPNPLVSGKGIELLKEAGLTVDIGILEEECMALNEQFFTKILTRQPFVTLKSAMSLDGKIATVTGDSKWITNETSRKDGHILRATHDCIVVGIGTILADNPILDVRLTTEELKVTGLQHPQNPTVVILDSKGRTPLDAAVFNISNRSVLIYVSEACTAERQEALRLAGANVIQCAEENNGISIDFLLSDLSARGYISILVEGGSQVIASFIEAKAIDKIVTYVGGMLIGGTKAIPAIGGKGFAYLCDTLPLTFKRVEILDNNVKIEAYYSERRGRYVHRNN